MALISSMPTINLFSEVILHISYGYYCTPIIIACQHIFLWYSNGQIKPVLIAAIVLAILVYFAPRSYCQEAPAKNQQRTDNQSSVTGNQVHPETETPRTDKQPPSWYESSEWMLVIVGFITAIAVGLQSWWTRRSADAANRNIELIMDERRARRAQMRWVIVWGLVMDGQLTEWWELAGEKEENSDTEEKSPIHPKTWIERFSDRLDKLSDTPN
jgi:hypothetical protein